MISTIPLHSFTCCPSFWDDQRTIDDQGHVQGVVIHHPSGDVYGKTFPSDTNAKIQIKMGLLFIGTPLIGIIRIASRIGHLFSGQWAWKQGYEEALASWKTDRRISALANTPEKAPGQIALYTRVALYSLYRFSEALLKLITQPLALILAMSAALLAAADPLLSRHFFAKIEDIWSVRLGEWNFFDSIINYSAPCMQPSRVANKRNFYRAFTQFDPESIRSQLFSLEKILKDHHTYFPKEDFSLFLESIKTVRNNIKKISQKDETETKIIKDAAYFPEKEKIMETRTTLNELTKLVHSSLEKIDQLVDEHLKKLANTQAILNLAQPLQPLRQAFSALSNIV
jgi:hypothetical protein